MWLMIWISRAMDEMWNILDADKSGLLTFQEFADGVVGNYSVNIMVS